MKPFRTVLFWLHLGTGVVAGAVILLMCVTGVVLTYEKQMLEWADRRSGSVPLPADARPLPPETLLAKVIAAEPGAAPTGITMRADPLAPATITLEGNRSRLVDPYSGAAAGRAVAAAAPVLPHDHQLAPLPGARRDGPRHRQGDHRRRQSRVPLHRPERHVPVGAAGVELAAVQAGAVVPRRSAGEGARLQLAQRDRHLVGRAAGDCGRWRGADLVFVGREPRLPHRR